MAPEFSGSRCSVSVDMKGGQYVSSIWRNSPSFLHWGLRQRMICYCWYVTNFGDQVGLTTNAALQKEWSHQLALWISYQGTGDDDHRNITEYHHYPGQLNSWPCHWLSQSVILRFQHLQSTADLSKTHVTFLTIEWLIEFSDTVGYPWQVEELKSWQWGVSD